MSNQNNFEDIPSRKLLNEILGLMKMRGDSLNAWCNRHDGISYPNARKYLLGLRNGPKAREWRQRIVEAARQSTGDSL